MLGYCSIRQHVFIPVAQGISHTSPVAAGLILRFPVFILCWLRSTSFSVLSRWCLVCMGLLSFLGFWNGPRQQKHQQQGYGKRRHDGLDHFLGVFGTGRPPGRYGFAGVFGPIPQRHSCIRSTQQPTTFSCVSIFLVFVHCVVPSRLSFFGKSSFGLQGVCGPSGRRCSCRHRLGRRTQLSLIFVFLLVALVWLHHRARRHETK
mmetsp:Transcript_3568/g.22415  ORF Transcript_3568/g.22415 Transcript_3568/m.22415 type:complete len:204 (-) Transcript_3568:66-677(-)